MYRFPKLPVLALLIASAGLHAAADEFRAFQSPSGNISCMAMAGSWNGVRCDMAELTPSFPIAPGWCDLDWGHAFEIGATGGGQPACVGDTVRDPTAPVLDYGHSMTFGGVTCQSARTGMTCMNAAGRGFSIARARQLVF